MVRRLALVGALAAATLAGCGGNDGSLAAKPLPRVQVKAGHGTDIGALPTVAPPPALKAGRKRTARGPAVQPGPTPNGSATPAPTTDVTSVDPVTTRGPVSATGPGPASTPGESLGPEQGGG